MTACSWYRYAIFYLHTVRGIAQMGLHVFFGCYFNLFRLMAKCGVLENLLLKVGAACECAFGRG